MKKVFMMLAAILTICGTMTTLTSCSDSDDEYSLTPEEQLKIETFEKVKGIRSDAAFEQLGVGRLFQFNADGTYYCTTYYHSDNDGDGIMDETENISVFTKGTWKPLGNTYSELAGKSFDAVAVEYKIAAIVETPSFKTIAKEDTTVYRDILYIVPNPKEGVNFIFQSDLLKLKMMVEQGGIKAETRSWWDDLVNTVARGVQTVKETASDAWKWVKKAVADVYTPDVTGYSDWMGTAFKDVNPKVHEITLPGTHDTFTYEIGRLIGAWARTQVLNLEEQFDAGVRYFDFRIGTEDDDDDDLIFWHGFISCDVALKETMDKLRDLLKAHPGEMVVAMLKYEDKDPTQRTINLLRKELEPYKDLFVDESKLGPDLRLNDCRGKILLMQRFSENSFNNASFGIYCGGGEVNEIRENRYGNKKWKVMEQDMCECEVDNDAYKTELNGKQVSVYDYFQYRKGIMEANFRDAENTPADRPDTWHINKTSGYLKFMSYAMMSYSRNAIYMNKYASQYISEHLGEKTGWVIMDFAGVDEEGVSDPVKVYGAELIKVLIQNNYAMVRKGVLK